MTKLRQKFISHLQLRGYAKNTIRNYIESMIMFARFFNRCPLELEHKHVKEYLLYLRNVKKLAVRTINIHMYSIKSFYDHFQPEKNIMGDIRRMKEPVSLPDILSRQEVNAMIDQADNLKIKAAVAVLYSSGIRLSECNNLTLDCIERDRMILRIIKGKGAKDRNAVLSTKTLSILEDYWREYRPEVYLFEGYKKGMPLSKRRFQNYVVSAAHKVKITKHVTPHTLRHTFATHLLEDGIALKVIQDMLGHAHVTTTTIYTHVSSELLNKVGSPFDAPAKGAHHENS